MNSYENKQNYRLRNRARISNSFVRNFRLGRRHGNERKELAVIVNITVQQVGSEWFNVALDYTGNSQFPYGLAAATTHWPTAPEESKLPWNRASSCVPPFSSNCNNLRAFRQLKRKAETWVDPSSKFSRRVTVCNLKGREGKIDKKKKKEKRMEKRRIRNGEMEVIRLVTYRNFIIIVCDSRFSFNCQKLYTTSAKSRALCWLRYTNVRDNWKLIIGISWNQVQRTIFFYTFFLFSLKFSKCVSKNISWSCLYLIVINRYW